MRHGALSFIFDYKAQDMECAAVCIARTGPYARPDAPGLDAWFGAHERAFDVGRAAEEFARDELFARVVPAYSRQVGDQSYCGF